MRPAAARQHGDASEVVGQINGAAIQKVPFAPKMGALTRIALMRGLKAMSLR